VHAALGAGASCVTAGGFFEAAGAFDAPVAADAIVVGGARIGVFTLSERGYAHTVSGAVDVVDQAQVVGTLTGVVAIEVVEALGVPSARLVIDATERREVTYAPLTVELITQRRFIDAAPLEALVVVEAILGFGLDRAGVFALAGPCAAGALADFALVGVARIGLAGVALLIAEGALEAIVVRLTGVRVDAQASFANPAGAICGRRTRAQRLADSLLTTCIAWHAVIRGFTATWIHARPRFADTEVT
jgi:hypothetical protein